MKIGVVGLPNVGKSTLFNALSQAGAESENYPFCTIEPNVGVVDIKDERLEVLGKLFNSKKIIPACIEFVDIAGLVEGASKGAGLGNKFLSHIREVDAIVHVVRCFENEKVINIYENIDPKRDIEIINLELILADIDTVERRLEKTKKASKQISEIACREAEILEKLRLTLEKGQSIRLFLQNSKLSTDEKNFINSLFLLSAKPVIYAANIDENDVGKEKNLYVKIVENISKQENSTTIVLCAKIEEELVGLNADEREMFKTELGIHESGLDKLAKAGFSILGLMTFLTAGEKEARAWTIEKNSKAPQAAGKIHSDFERGFIKAEIVNYTDLISYGSWNAAKEKGKVRIEGKEYIMQDGDVVIFKFNV